MTNAIVTCCLTALVSAEPPPPPNVLVVVADDHAPYVAGCYGNSLVRTPNIDRLAAEGVRFTRAYCNSPVCTASRQSFLTGMLPHTVGVTLLQTALADEHTTLAELLKQHGYRTAAIGKMHFNSPRTHGFDLRIDTAEHNRYLRERPRRAVPADVAVLPEWRPFKDHARDWLNGMYVPFGAYDDDMTGTYFAREAVRFLAEPRDEPFFLMVSYYEPHSPFRFPIEFAGRHDPAKFDVPRVGPDDDRHVPAIFRDLTDDDKRRIIASYYTSVEFMDKNVGLVLDELRRSGLDRDTLVVYLGDHGYSLGQHGHFEKHCFFEPAVRAPLIVRDPSGAGRGRVAAGLVEFIDIFPTVAEFCGVPVQQQVQGRSLWPQCRGERDSGRNSVFSEYLENEEAMIRTERWKLVYTTGRRERQDGYATGRPLPGRTKYLFDLETDPNELTNLSHRPEYAAIVAELQRQLYQRLVQTQPPGRDVPAFDSEEAAIDWCLVPRDQ